MNEEEKKILIEEIRKYDGYDEEAESGNLIIESNDDERTPSLLTMLKDEKVAKKLIISNKYGLLGSLLYKYRNNLDNEVILEMHKSDLTNVADVFLYYVIKEQLEISNNIKELYVNAIKGGINEISYNILKYVSEELRDDKEFMLEAVKQDGWTLKYASEELKNDKEIVMEAVKQDGEALAYASKELKNDREVVLEAIKNNSGALYYASKELKNDREVVLEAIKQDVWALKYASKKLKNDREVVLTAVKNNSGALYYASKELKNDREVVLEAIKQDGWALKYASEELQKDSEIILATKRHEIHF